MSGKSKVPIRLHIIPTSAITALPGVAVKTTRLAGDPAAQFGERAADPA